MKRASVSGAFIFSTIIAVIGTIIVGCGGSDETSFPLLTGTVTGRPTAYQTVAVSPDGGYILMGDDNSNVIQLLTPEGDVLWQYTLPTDEQMQSGAISANASIVVVGGQNGAVYALSKEGTLLWQKARPSEEVQVAVTDAGDKIIAGHKTVSCYTAGGVELWTKEINTRGWTIWGIAVSSDGSRLIITTNSDVILCDGNGVELAFFDVIAGNNIYSADLRGDGTQFAVLYSDGDAYRVALYDVASGELWRQTLYGGGYVSIDNAGEVFATSKDHDTVMYSSTGELLASWSANGTTIGADNAGRVCVVGMIGDVLIYQMR